MSKTSDIYDGMVTRLSTMFPEPYFRLPNPYKPEENSETFLRLGWGIQFGPAINTRRQISCNMSLQRSLTVVLTREFFALEEDAIGKSDAEKLLLEDQYTLMKDFEKNPTVNGVSFLTTLVSDGGIEYVFRGKDLFLMLRTTFTSEYLENLT